MDKDVLKFTSFMVFVVLIHGLILNFLCQRSCENYEEVTGRESKWIFMDSCYVKKDDGKWIRYDLSFKE